MSEKRTPPADKIRRKKKRRPRLPDLGPFGDLRWNAPPDPGQPAWAPSKAEVESVPASVRQPLMEFILPIYERSVLQTADPVERSLGVTATHLLWLEVLEQYHQKQQQNAEFLLGGDNSRQDQIAQLLRVLDTKVRVGHLLVRLQELRAMAAARQMPSLTQVLDTMVRDQQAIDHRPPATSPPPIRSPQSPEIP